MPCVLVLFVTSRQRIHPEGVRDKSRKMHIDGPTAINSTIVGRPEVTSIVVRITEPFKTESGSNRISPDASQLSAARFASLRDDLLVEMSVLATAAAVLRL